MSLDRLIYKIKCRVALAGAGGQHSPDAFAPGSALFAASALCNTAVYDNKPYSLFDKVISRLYIRRCDETKISVAMLAKPISQVLCLFRLRDIGQCLGKKCLSVFVHSFSKGFVANLLSLMEDAKHFTYSFKQSFAVSYGRFVTKCCQILEFANKVCQAKLHQNITVLHIICDRPRNSRIQERRQILHREHQEAPANSVCRQS